jgi:high-affinity iron transporter
VVHLLDYLAKDYAGAIGSGGTLISASEFAEQQEFSKEVVTVSGKLPELAAHPEVLQGLTRLNNLIVAKGEPRDVAALARSLQAQIIQITNLATTPATPPNVAHGKELFIANCSSCHGITGNGDGPAAASLNPKPANLASRERMQGTTPMHVFNSARLGIPGTAMPAFANLSDQDIWDVSYYVLSLSGAAPVTEASQPVPDVDILKTARSGLNAAAAAYRHGNAALAKAQALRAYLDGIEPLEPRLRASDPTMASSVEEKMAMVRSAISQGASLPEFDAALAAANKQLDLAQDLLVHKELAPGIAFLAASSILLREGFEAVLMILALLGVIRAMGSRRAALWVHAGWLSALACGAVAWIFSGYLIDLSGAGREMMEAITSLLAVVVLLIVGFWLHSRTEIGRWNHFIKVKVRHAMVQKNHFGLASIAFIAVFREAIETVLFLRAIWVDSGDQAKLAVGLGVGLTLVGLIVACWAILQFSARIPVRKLFAVSAVVMAVLALILTGKGLHSLQEAGMLSVTTPALHYRFELLGVFPTYETILTQVALLIMMVVLWKQGRRPSRPPRT